MTTIAIGVVFVLLLGEIDLSIGYVVGDRRRRRREAPVPRRELGDDAASSRSSIAVIVTALIGLFQGSFVAIIGVPSFVVTLAGLLFWQGVILYSIGDQGVIVIDDSLVNNVSNYFFSDTAGYLIAAIATGLFVLVDAGGGDQSPATRDLHGQPRPRRRSSSSASRRSRSAPSTGRTRSAASRSPSCS